MPSSENQYIEVELSNLWETISKNDCFAINDSRLLENVNPGYREYLISIDEDEADEELPILSVLMTEVIQVLYDTINQVYVIHIRNEVEPIELFIGTISPVPPKSTQY